MIWLNDVAVATTRLCRSCIRKLIWTVLLENVVISHWGAAVPRVTLCFSIGVSDHKPDSSSFRFAAPDTV